MSKFKRKINPKNFESQSRNMFIGIDPGQSGALAMINDINEVMELHDWPGDEIQTADLVREIMEAVNQSGHKITAALEYAHSMPKQGVSSTFKFGTNYGIWRGILAANQIPFYIVRPQLWQRGVIKKAQDKKPALAAAARIFPLAVHNLYGPRGGGKDGRADALLIAFWCKGQPN